MMQPPIDLRDRFLGCLLGCAVGDALGAAYEGYWSHDLPDEQTLLSEFAEVEGYPRGQYTDDTQLTVATIKAILKTSTISPHHIARAISRLWENQSVVGPVGACTHAANKFMGTGDWTTCGAPVGQAGNGTAMRTAILGLYFLQDADSLPSVVADVCRITHQDPRSIAGGVAIAKAAQLLTSGCEGPHEFCEAVARVIDSHEQDFANMVRGLSALMKESPDVAVRIIAWSGMRKPEFEQPIITPFVIPTVLAALWCVLRHPDSWGRAVATVIRLGGDVDSTGAIVGALMGAKLGITAIPQHLLDGVLDSERLQGLAIRYHDLVIRTRLTAP